MQAALALGAGAAGAGSSNAPDSLIQQLHQLPGQVLLHDILPKWTPADKKVLRAVNRLARSLINAVVRAVKLQASQLMPGPGHAQYTIDRLAADYPDLCELTLADSKSAALKDAAFTAFLAAGTASPRGSLLLGRLTFLDMKHCHFLTHVGVAALVAAVPGLQQLRLGRWADGAQLRELARMPCLTHLDLGDSDVDILSVDIKVLSYIPNLKHLTHVSLQRCTQVTAAGLAHVARLPRLTSLNLTGTHIACAAPLAACTSLQRLSLGSCRAFGDAGMAAVCRLPGLLALHAGGTAISGQGLLYLREAPQLQELDLGKQWEVNDEGMLLLCSCPNLRSLRVGNFNLTQPLPHGVLACLTYLAFGGAYVIKGLPLLLPLPALEELHVWGLDAVTDGVVATVARQDTLKVLELSGGSHLSAAGLMRLAGLPALQRLCLAGVPCASDPALVRALLRASRSITSVSVVPKTGASEEQLYECTRRR